MRILVFTAFIPKQAGSKNQIGFFELTAEDTEDTEQKIKKIDRNPFRT